MKRNQVVLSWLAAIFLLQGCDLGVITDILEGGKRLPGPGGSFTLDYAAYRETGPAAVTGTIRLTRIDSERVEGTWDLTATGSPDGLGPQTGSGRAVGTASDTTLSLNLNPDYVDNNVLLYGRKIGGAFVGTWEWVGFPGVITRGSFRGEIR